ncbi:MAG: twin transmembrane helix small protein [Pseudomonadota bacterium]|nr:twin transmembrane helix small protein [Pseudomonadota bacterium]
MKYVILVFIVFILGSLFSALYYMIRDKGQSTRAVRALTWRVGLSIMLFLILMLGSYFGLISPQGLMR